MHLEKPLYLHLHPRYLNKCFSLKNNLTIVCAIVDLYVPRLTLSARTRNCIKYHVRIINIKRYFIQLFSDAIQNKFSSSSHRMRLMRDAGVWLWRNYLTSSCSNTNSDQKLNCFTRTVLLIQDLASMNDYECDAGWGDCPIWEGFKQQCRKKIDALLFLRTFHVGHWDNHRNRCCHHRRHSGHRDSRHLLLTQPVLIAH